MSLSQPWMEPTQGVVVPDNLSELDRAAGKRVWDRVRKFVESDRESRRILRTVFGDKPADLEASVYLEAAE